MKSVPDLLQKVVETLPERMRPTVVLSLVVVSIGAVIGGWLIREDMTIVGMALGIPIVAFGVVGLLLSLMRSFREPPIVAVGDEETVEVKLLAPGYKQLFGNVLVGIELQAEVLDYGIINVRQPDRDALPAEIETVLEDSIQLPRLDTDAYYDALTKAIKEVLRRNRPSRAHGIGLAIPGLVNPMTDRIVKAPEYFPDRDAIIGELSSRLADDELVRSALGVMGSDSAERDISSRFLIDNDVRCQTRDLLRTKKDADGWRNYAYVFVGKKGVAVGLVFDRNLYYGSRLRAGEFGHSTIHLLSEVEEPVIVASNGSDEVHLRMQTAPVCKCEKRGVHWEALITEQALSDLTERVAPGRAAIARLLEAGGPADPTSSRESPVADETVIETYARYVAVGIANLVNTLDLDHAVLGGRLIRDLWKLRDLRFARIVQDHVAKHTVQEPPEDDFYDLAEVKGWRGAALLFRDPGFHALLSRRTG